MPSSVIAKIELGRRRTQVRSCIFLGIAASVLIVRLVLPYGAPMTVLRAYGHSITLRVADTTQARQQGLSGKKTMQPDQGMVFVYTQATKQCFWMKGMHFSLDIVWLNASKQVVYLKSQVSPATYPQSFCTPTAAEYVIELKSGVAQTLGIRDGVQLHF